MSLLLDALRKAEEQRRQRAEIEPLPEFEPGANQSVAVAFGSDRAAGAQTATQNDPEPTTAPILDLELDLESIDLEALQEEDEDPDTVAAAQIDPGGLNPLTEPTDDRPSVLESASSVESLTGEQGPETVSDPVGASSREARVDAGLEQSLASVKLDEPPASPTGSELDSSPLRLQDEPQSATGTASESVYESGTPETHELLTGGPANLLAASRTRRRWPSKAHIYSLTFLLAVTGAAAYLYVENFTYSVAEYPSIDPANIPDPAQPAALSASTRTSASAMMAGAKGATPPDKPEVYTQMDGSAPGTSPGSRSPKKSFDIATTSAPGQTDTAQPAGDQTNATAFKSVIAEAPEIETASTAVIQVKRRVSKKKSDHRLGEAYRLLTLKHYAQARSAYRDVLEVQPDDVDALTGLSAVAIAQRRYAEATELLIRALKLDPSNSYARASLLALSPTARGEAVFSQLKMLIDAHPEMAELYFVLGNLYASRGQWPEAQQAYFDAFSRDSEHPDYAYNLAVSLDHLSKSEAAARYYRLALQLADRTGAAFPRTSVTERLESMN